MVTQRILMSGAGACVALGALAGQAHAQAYDRDHNVSVQERAYDEHAPLGIGLGGFLLFPQLDLSIGFNDNIYAATANETDDTILGVGASARLASQWSRHALNFFGGVQTRTFLDNDDDNAVDWRLGADGRIDIRRELYVRGGAAFGHATESRFAGTGPAALVEPIEYDFLTVESEVVYNVNRIRLGAGVEYGNVDYEDGRLFAGPVFDQDDRDAESWAFKGRVDYAISPDTALFGQVTRRTVNYEQDGGFSNGVPVLDRDSEGWRYIVGANFDLTSVIRGEVGVGYSDTEYDSPLLDDVDGFAAEAQVEWFVTQLTTLTFNASRETTDAGVSGAAGIERTTYAARADHEFRRDIVFTAGLRLDQDEYQSFDRDDDRSRFDAGVDWYANRMLTLGASYERYEQDSDGLQRDRDYTANVFMLKATLRR
jgi:hypothetical protein